MLLASVFSNPWVVSVGSTLLAGMILLIIERWLKRREQPIRPTDRSAADAESEQRDSSDKALEWEWALIATGTLSLVFLLAFLGVIVLRDDGPASASPPVKVGLNEAVRHGAFVFTLTHFQCGFDLVEEAIPRRPAGEYCLASFSVVNRGDRSEYPDPIIDDWVIRVGEKRYDRTWSYGPAFNRNIFPDQGAEGTLVFDIPKGSIPTAVVIPSDFESRGIVFNLN